MLRRINSLLILPIFLLILTHVLLMAGLLTGIVGFNPNFKYISYTLLALVLIHTFFGIIFMIQRIAGKRSKQRSYPSQNTAFYVQMISGILMVLLVAIHMTAYGYTTPDGTFILRDPTLIYYITECLLAITVFFHCWVSIPRLAVSLGVVAEKSGMKKIRVVTTVICLIFLAVALTAFSLYYLPTILGGLL